MFTGLVEDVGRVVSVAPRGAEAVTLRLETRLVETGPLGPELELGASLAVDGVCLTITWRREGQAGSTGEVEVVAAFETLQRTTLGRLRANDRVNLERSLRYGDRLGGHLVTGHVDGVGTVRSLTRRGDALEIRFGLAREMAQLTVEKGSITVEGVSLTVNQVGDDWFEVGLIPHTLEVTTLGQLAVGSPVNLETDILGKYVARLLPGGPARTAGVTRELLERAGYTSRES